MSSPKVVVRNTALPKKTNPKRRKKKQRTNKGQTDMSKFVNKNQKLSNTGRKLYNTLNGDLGIIQSAVRRLSIERVEMLIKILMLRITDEKKPGLKKEVEEFIAKEKQTEESIKKTDEYFRYMKHKKEVDKRKESYREKRRREKQDAQRKEEERLAKIRNLYSHEEDPNDHAIHICYVDNKGNKKTEVTNSVNKWISETFYGPTETAAKISLLPEHLRNTIQGYHHFRKFQPCGIYRFYNDDGMSYIGQSKDVWSRASQHLSPSTLECSNGKLQQYIREHGCDNLKFEILVYSDKLGKASREDLRKHFEAFLIQEYDSINNGWNKKAEHTLEEGGFDIEGTRKLCESWGILPEKG